MGLVTHSLQQIHADTPDRVSDPKGWRKYAETRDQAVGEIRRHISPELRSITVSSSDPEMILEAIQVTYGTSSFATQHNALQAFLAVKQEASELVAAFIGCSREAFSSRLGHSLCLIQRLPDLSTSVFAPGVLLRTPDLGTAPGNLLQCPNHLLACPDRFDSAAS